MYPFPHFRAFVYGTPVIPDIYWNAYTYEERIKKLCCEYDKLIHYLDALVDTVNAQQAEIENINENLPEAIAEAFITDPAIREIFIEEVSKYLHDLTTGTTYRQLNEKGFLFGED